MISEFVLPSSELVSSFELSAQCDGDCRSVDWSAMPPRKPYKIFLAVPNAGAIMPPAIEAIGGASRQHAVIMQPLQFGDIEHNFNMMWCNALNNRLTQGVTHFAMIHSDIGVEQFWLDILVEEMDRVNADVMTGVNAIKDGRGLTTTGIRYPGVWGTRRFTMKEIMRLPETFSVADTDEPDGILAINTGLWLCRLPIGGWCDRFNGFTCKHRIDVLEDGTRNPWFDSEDWLFSDWLHDQGIRVYATRRPKAFHRGGQDYPNQGVWGTWETEKQRPKRPLSRAIKSPGVAIHTEKPIAVDSLDHTQPLGAAQDNSVSYAFNRKLFQLIPAEQCRVLDLGCAGGGFVRTILEAGGFAIGIDGSDNPKKTGLGEWKVIPDHLFTADLTEPFDLLPDAPHPAGLFAVKFNVITAWEVFEHFKEEKIDLVLSNILKHAEPGTLLICSISLAVEPHHQTVQPKQWWIERIQRDGGFVHAPDLEEHFRDDLVRGDYHPQAYSQPVMFRCQNR